MSTFGISVGIWRGCTNVGVMIFGVSMWTGCGVARDAAGGGGGGGAGGGGAAPCAMKARIGFSAEMFETVVAESVMNVTNRIACAISEPADAMPRFDFSFREWKRLLCRSMK